MGPGATVGVNPRSPLATRHISDAILCITPMASRPAPAHPSFLCRRPLAVGWFRAGCSDLSAFAIRCSFFIHQHQTWVVSTEQRKADKEEHHADLALLPIRPESLLVIHALLHPTPRHDLSTFLPPRLRPNLSMILTRTPCSQQASRSSSRSKAQDYAKGEPMGGQELQEASSWKVLQDLPYRR